VKVVTGYAESALLDDKSGIAVQFERIGYFVKDIESKEDNLVFNRTVGLKSTW